MVLNRFIHDRLGEHRLIAFVMPVPTVAPHIDHNVLFEPLAIFDRDTRDVHAGFRVVAIDVEDRRRDDLRHIRTVWRGSGIIGTRGKTNLVVDNKMDGAASPIAAKLRKIERLGHDTLAGESGIAVK